MENLACYLVERNTKKLKENCGVVSYGYCNIRDSAVKELLDSLETELGMTEILWKIMKVNNGNCNN